MQCTRGGHEACDCYAAPAATHQPLLQGCRLHSGDVFSACIHCGAPNWPHAIAPGTRPCDCLGHGMVHTRNGHVVFTPAIPDRLRLPAASPALSVCADMSKMCVDTLRWGRSAVGCVTCVCPCGHSTGSMRAPPMLHASASATAHIVWSRVA